MKKSQKEKYNIKKEKQKEKGRQPDRKTRIAHISKALPFSFDKEANLFITDEKEYIKMIRINGINLYGLKDHDKDVRMLRLQELFNPIIGAGQIYSYEVPANVDSYINDYEVFKKRLDIKEPKERIKYSILEENEEILLDNTISRQLVDRCFLLIVKDRTLSKLNQKVINAMNIMSTYNYCEELNIQQMKEIIYSYYNPSESLFANGLFDISDDVMDLIYPDRIGYVDKNFEQYISLNGIYCTSLYVSKFKRTDLGFLSMLSTYEDAEFSLHFEPAPKDEVKNELDKKLRNNSKNYNRMKEGSDKEKLRSDQERLLELINQVNVDDDLPMCFSVSIRLKADSKKHLIEYENAVKKDLLSAGFQVRSAMYQSLDMFNLTAPICVNKVPNYMKQTTNDTLGWSYPFVFETLYDSTEKYDMHKNYICNYPPLYLGHTSTTGGVVCYDNFTKANDRANYNEFIEGTSGFGKTTLIMNFIKFRHGIGYKQYILDVEGRELNKLTYLLGGEIINCSNGEYGRINPLHVRVLIPESLESEDDDRKISLSSVRPLAAHIRYLRSFLKSYRGETDEIGLLHNSMIEDCLKDIYREYGIDFDTTAQEIVDRKNSEFPVFSDLLARLREVKKQEEEKEINDSSIIKIANECIAFIKPLAEGADAEVFNGTTNINLDNSLFCFDFSGLHDNTNSDILGTQYLNVLSYIWSQVSSSDRQNRIQIYEDEVSIINKPNYKNIMIMNDDMTRRVRKYMCGITFATQQLLDMLKPSIEEYTTTIMTQPTYHFHFNTDYESLEYMKSRNILPESEIDWLKTAKIGQCFAMFGKQTSMRVNIEINERTLEQFEKIKG